MKKSKKISIIVSVVLMTLGLILSLSAAVLVNFDFSKLNTIKTSERVCQIEKPFIDIEVISDSSTVLIKSSSDVKSKVICRESENIKTDISVENDTLKIVREGFERSGIVFSNESSPKADIEIYLSKSDYKNLEAVLKGGDIKIESGLEFSNINIKTQSGDVCAESGAAKRVSVKSSSGQIRLSFESEKAEVEIENGSGDIILTDLKCKSLSAQTSAGQMNYTNVVATQKMTLKAMSGDITFHSCDAASAAIETVSGNVTGTFLSEKSFVTKTQSGNIEVPQKTIGGRCSVKTSSGDISLDIAK